MAWDSKRQIFTTITNSKAEEEELLQKEKRIHRGAKHEEFQRTVVLTEEDTIEQARCLPEYQTVAAFLAFKRDDEDDTFTTADLQALARSVDFKERHLAQALPPADIVRAVRAELTIAGLQPVERAKVRHYRGAMSAAHGSSPYAGFGGGGSGMGSDTEGPVGFGHGGGPGAIGGGYKWDKNDRRNLRMGS